MPDNESEAKALAGSALIAAKASKDKSMEIRAYFIQGRINNILENFGIAEAYYDTALAITEKFEDNWYRGEVLYRKGVISHSQSKEIDALEYFNASIHACRFAENYKTMGSSYSMMGTIFRINGLYDRAIEYIVNAKLNYEKANYPEGYAWSAYLLGRIYLDLKLPEKAMDYFQEALAIYTKQAAINGDSGGMALCFEQIGLINLDAGNFDEAHNYIDKTLNIFTGSKSTYGQSNAHKNLGLIEYSRGNYELAEKYLNEALMVKIKVGDFLNMPTVYEYLGLCFIGKGQMDKGLKSIQKGLDLAISNKQTRIQSNIYSKLTEVYLKNNDLKNAFRCQKEQIAIQDLLLSGTANIKIEQLQAIYEIDKKKGQIVELEKQNKINSLIIKQNRISQWLMIIGISIAFLISISIYWFNTKIRHKNLELRESNAAKDKFFAIIAHDLRGPTGNLASFLEYLNDTFTEHSPEELKRIVLELSKSAENVSVLLENLLIWAQSQLNKIEFRPTELKLSDVIQNSIKGIKHSAENKDIAINLKLDDQIYVRADHDMLQTIVRNILSNAIKFSFRESSVTIETEILNKETAAIRIIDNGVGIDAESLSKIFNISNTFHTNGTENEKSTGLGLILVKDFVEKNHGTINIESQKGEGTIVSFTLPAIQGN
ncbi:MAG: tetratricopeptide repeat-containing sensor histidine kinase [Prolixibacteraceae bacterium]